MNPQMEAAVRAIGKDAAEAEQARLAENARCQVVVTARMRLGQTDVFAEIKKDVQRDMSENDALLHSTHEPYLMYRAQGAIWALQAFLARYENAEGELKALETQAQETTPE